MLLICALILFNQLHFLKYTQSIFGVLGFWGTLPIGGTPCEVRWGMNFRVELGAWVRGSWSPGIEQRAAEDPGGGGDFPQDVWRVWVATYMH